jgi:hypothetical protein
MESYFLYVPHLTSLIICYEIKSDNSLKINTLITKQSTLNKSWYNFKYQNMKATCQ